MNPLLRKAFGLAGISPEEAEAQAALEAPAEAVQTPGPRPTSRLDEIRAYLEANRVEDPRPSTAPVDMEAAREDDRFQNFRRGMMSAGDAFLGRATPMPVPTNEAQRLAAGQESTRQQALREWADRRRQQTLGEAGIMARSELADEMARLRGEEIRQRGTQAETQADLKKRELEQEGAQKDRELDIKEAEARRKREAGAGKGKTLPVSEVGELSSLPVAEAQVDKVAEEFKRLNMGGMGGRAGGAVTDSLGLRWTDSAEYNAAVTLAMQAAGKIMEGGKLAAGDEAKYRSMLPRPGDSDAVVQQKVAGMKSFLRGLASSRAKALKSAGYDVPEELLLPGNPSGTPDIPPKGKVPMVSASTGATVYLSRESAAALEKAGKVRKP